MDSPVSLRISLRMRPSWRCGTPAAIGSSDGPAIDLGGPTVSRSSIVSLNLARECGGIRTPALRAAVQPLPMTNREREIATLAARGLSNRAIADQLVISVRTVEGHLYRLNAKMGGINRTDLHLFILDPDIAT